MNEEVEHKKYTFGVSSLGYVWFLEVKLVHDLANVGKKNELEWEKWQVGVCKIGLG